MTVDLADLDKTGKEYNLGRCFLWICDLDLQPLEIGSTGGSCGCRFLRRYPHRSVSHLGLVWGVPKKRLLEATGFLLQGVGWVGAWILQGGVERGRYLKGVVCYP